MKNRSRKPLTAAVRPAAPLKGGNPGAAILALAAVFSLAFVLMSCGAATAGSNVPKNAPYKDASLPVEKRVDDLLSRMTMEEKIGQMTQIEKGSLRGGDVKSLFLGSVLSGGGGSPKPNTASSWADMIDTFQDEALSTRLGIPMLYGVDSVHGHNNLKGATIFPHNIALGAANDADLVRRIGEATAKETMATGVPWTFAPCIAVARDPRWGRTYESFSQDTAIVTSLGTAFIEGFQGADGSVGAAAGTGSAPIATAKHFLGDGAARWGTSTTNNYKIDQGNAIGDDEYLQKVLLPPYEQAVKAGVRTVMVSFSSWNGLKMHAQKELITDLLKDQLGFTGFVVSDWGGMDQIDGDYYKAMVTGINAGVDMNMVPYDARKFIQTVSRAVEAGDISKSRIDDAVRRILRVKFEQGLFESPKANRSLASSIRSQEHLALAREAVAKTQVVLKNGAEGAAAGTAASLAAAVADPAAILPLDPSSKVFVAGAAADNIGIQCGGWTMEWQGQSGAITEGTTLLGGIREAVGADKVVYDPWARFAETDRKAVCVVVVGERPYAEGVGDSASLELNAGDVGTIERARDLFDRVVLIVLSGRPIVLGPEALGCSAIVASWLPGTEGAGVADVLFGKVAPTGKLPFDWLESTDQLPQDQFISGAEKPLWPVGHGLGW